MEAEQTQETGEQGRRRDGGVVAALARGIAFFFGAFGVLNAAGQQVHVGFDINVWWVDARSLPPAAGSLVVLASLAMLGYAVWPKLGRIRLIFTGVLVGGLAGAAVWNAVMFYQLRARGAFAGGPGVPLSLIVAACLLGVLAALPRGRSMSARQVVTGGIWAGGVVAAMGLAFPLAQMVFFGQTSYTRPVDAIVVFGAGVYPDGTMSQALGDRVRTACDLYNQGVAKYLIVSGGPGMGAVHETEAMRKAAIAAGVPPEMILVDRRGLNTDATVANTDALLKLHGLRSVLAVSHWYHLPRIKMTYQRAGWDVFTTPAVESPPPLQSLPHYVLREIAAVWVYYLRPLGV